MFDIISAIIDHTWNTQYTGDQQYIYYICGCLICVMIAVLMDGIYKLFTHFWRK